MNLLGNDDKVVIVNGGGFGQRFVDICNVYGIQNEELKLNYGEQITEDALSPFIDAGFTSMIINVHETSTGILYDMSLITKFCKQNNIFLIADAISSFLADEYNMEEFGVNVTILSSQKALALPPGLSFLILDKLAIARIKRNKTRSYYFNLKDYLSNAERGQTPFTPAVGIILQLNRRLKAIDEVGIESMIKNSSELAKDFREKISKLPFVVPFQNLSNALTPVSICNSEIAYDKLFTELKDKFQIFICPNGGELKNKLFRVGHIGSITTTDNNALINSIKAIINNENSDK